LRWQTSK
ncbi:acrB/AcrD/AcrF family protein, partial [Vibrio parahaemolyticus V-223/04]